MSAAKPIAPGVAVADQRDAAIRALAEHIYAAGFIESRFPNPEWADLAIRAAEDFAAAWDARK